jgi:hypothetical protein
VLLASAAGLTAFGLASVRTLWTSPRPAEWERDFLAMLLPLAWCFVAGNLRFFLCGMESTLVLPLCLAVLWLMRRRRYASAGVAAALLVAARLDTCVFFLAPTAAVCAWSELRGTAPRRRAAKALLLLVLPAAAFVSVYMLVNYVNWGHALPIHGVLKSTFPFPFPRWHNLFGVRPGLRGALLFRPLVSLVAAAAGTVMLLQRARVSAPLRTLGMAAALATAAQVAAFTLFQKWMKGVPDWYVGPALVTGAVALAAGAANRLPVPLLRAGAVACGLGMVVLNTADLAAGSGAVASGVPFCLGAADDTVAYARTTPRDALWAYTDCGALAFWSERRFVNLDGLVNNFAYQDRLRRGQLLAYLRERGVRYLAAGVWPRPQALRDAGEPVYRYRVAPDVFCGRYGHCAFYAYSYLYGTFSDTLRLPRSAEVWRSAVHRDNTIPARYVVFDLRRMPAE